jgi:secreted PhoX family phosphatase
VLKRSATPADHLGGEGGQMDRRTFLRASAGVGVLAIGGRLLTACLPPGYGPLGDPDANGLRLPQGFTSRVIATSGQPVAGTGFTWPVNPDGGACFAVPGGGWVYVANSESLAPVGGASVIRFDGAGTIVEARSILSGTNVNCAGGPTPWGTWLSCEEHGAGQVWETYPLEVRPAVARPAMGRFSHEAAAVDTDHGCVYLTEDRPDGGLYRFTPTTWPDLAAGRLDILTTAGDGSLAWAEVPDPGGSPTPTRSQLASTRRFNGGEGIWWRPGAVCFATKGDNRVWVYLTASNELSVFYDRATSPSPELSGVDNILVSPAGELLVAEDGGDMQLVVVSGNNGIPALQLTGVSGSEMTGPALSPDGTRLYFSSQRNPGRTYEVTGPWHA